MERSRASDFLVSSHGEQKVYGYTAVHARVYEFSWQHAWCNLFPRALSVSNM